LWVEAHHPTASGVVVTVGGGRGLRLAFRGAPLDAVESFEAIGHVDIELGGDDFGISARALGLAKAPPPKTFVGWLWPNTQRASGLFAMMAPWFAAIGLLVVFGIAMGPLGLADRLENKDVQQFLPGVMAVVVIAAGLGLTLRRNRRVPVPAMCLRATDDRLWIAARNGRVVVDTTLRPGLWTPYRHLTTSGMRGMGGLVTLSGLRITPHGGRPLTIGARTCDARFPPGVPLGTEPAWVIAPETWETLVTHLARVAPPPGVRIGLPPPRPSDSLADGPPGSPPNSLT
jgi:hypothetical protein